MGLGVPKDGLWLREDVDMKCNVMATGFVKKTLKKAHATLVERLVEKAHLRESEIHNSRIEEHNSILSYYSESTSPEINKPLPSPDPARQNRYSLDPQPSPLPAHQSFEHRGSFGKAPYPYSPPMEAVQQPFADPRYSQPPLDPRYSQPPTELRYSQPPAYAHDPRHSFQPYQPHQPVEIAPSESRIAELPSSTHRQA